MIRTSIHASNTHTHIHTKKKTRTETNTRLNIQNKTKKNEKNRVAGRTNWLDRQTDRQAK